MAFQLSSPIRVNYSARNINRRSISARRNLLTVRCAASSFEKRQVLPVNPETGYSDGVAGSVPIADLFVDLPSQRVQGLDIDISTERSAQAVIYAREADFDDGFSRAPPAVVFLHGFSQRPRNYESTLRLLAAQGYLVIAPRTWLFDVAWPWSRVEGSKEPGKRCSSAQAKLQSALLIDALRCVSWTKQNAGGGSVALLGHSMGGAIALIAARALGENEVASVATLAPAVVGTALTEMNTLLNWDDGGMAKFVGTFGNTPLFIAQGAGDRVVKLADTKRLFEKFVADRAAGIVGLCEMFPGSHVGFEDSLRVDVGFLRILDTLLFLLIDFIVFREWGETDEQLELTKKLLLVWFSEAGAANTNAAAAAMEKLMEAGVDTSDGTYTWGLEPYAEKEEEKVEESEKRDLS